MLFLYQSMLLDIYLQHYLYHILYLSFFVIEYVINTAALKCRWVYHSRVPGPP